MVRGTSRARLLLGSTDCERVQIELVRSTTALPLPGPLREVIYSQMAGTGHECAEPVDKSPSETPRPLALTGGHNGQLFLTEFEPAPAKPSPMERNETMRAISQDTQEPPRCSRRSTFLNRRRDERDPRRRPRRRRHPDRLEEPRPGHHHRPDAARPQFPDAAYDEKRAISEGDLVLLHSNSVVAPGAPKARRLRHLPLPGLEGLGGDLCLPGFVHSSTTATVYLQRSDDAVLSDIREQVQQPA
jgi:hypothetical protein